MAKTKINPSQINNIVDITYTNLVSAISASALTIGSQYRITDYQTVHTIPVANVLYTGAPIEPLIVIALANNKISEEAKSEQYPQDKITYTVTNSIPGSTKGSILYRHDLIQNVKVCNDFRNVKYRRWKFAPVAFNIASAYTQNSAVQGADGALYYLSKPGGYTAGAATEPSATNDDWVRVFENNNFYYGRGATATASIAIVNVGNVPYANPAFPINTSDFIDTPTFLNYGTGYKNIVIDNTPGSLCNLVFYDVNQAAIAEDIYISPQQQSNSIVTEIYTSTFIVLGSIKGFNINRGISNSYLTFTGTSSKWVSNYYNTSLCINGSVFSSTFSGSYSVFRGTIFDFQTTFAQFFVSPARIYHLNALLGIGNLKFSTNAYIYSWMVLSALGLSETPPPAGVISSYSTEVFVNVPLSYRTFIGTFESTQSGVNNGSAADLIKLMDMAKTQHLVYAYEQPSAKSTIIITGGTSSVVAWQTDKPGVNLTSPSGTDSSDKRLQTYFSKHGNDFQVQQKDLISGVWIPNINVAFNYTIDTVDGNGNITQITFNPESGSTESRFIII